MYKCKKNEHVGICSLNKVGANARGLIVFSLIFRFFLYLFNLETNKENLIEINTPSWIITYSDKNLFTINYYGIFCLLKIVVAN